MRRPRFRPTLTHAMLAVTALALAFAGIDRFARRPHPISIDGNSNSYYVRWSDGRGTFVRGAGEVKIERFLSALWVRWPDGSWSFYLGAG